MAGLSPEQAHRIKADRDKGYYAESLVCSIYSRFCACMNRRMHHLTDEQLQQQHLGYTLNTTFTHPQIDQVLKVDAALILSPIAEAQPIKVVGLQVSTIRDSEVVREKANRFYDAPNKISADIAVSDRQYVDASDLHALALVEKWQKNNRAGTPDLLLRSDQVLAYARKFLHALPPEYGQFVSAHGLVADWCERYPDSRAAQDVQQGRNYGSAAR